MPYYDTSDEIEFRYVNQKDPYGEKGLKPYSWNLKKDETGNLIRDADGHCIVIEADHGPEDSYWLFAAAKDQSDDDIIDRKMIKTNIKVDRKKARRMGRAYSPDIEQQQLMSALMALITTMSRGWFGPEFVLPVHFKDPEDKNPNKALRRVHHLAGKMTPPTQYWMAKRHPFELAAVEKFLNDLYEPEGEEEEEAEFRASGESVDGPGPAGNGAVRPENREGALPLPA